MDSRHVLALVALTAGLAACDSGDIILSPTAIDSSTPADDPSTMTGAVEVENPCASHTEAGQTFQGEFTEGNCVYDSLFVSDTKPITVSAITFAALDNDGMHIFKDSLYIGEDVDANAAATGKRIPQEGEGTRLMIAAGNTMVFEAQDSYVRVARGSQIFAEGSPSAPITFTVDEDVILDTATESDRGLWGGLQINGNGRTNKCHDGTSTGSGSGTVSDFDATSNNVHNCHVTAEGRPATYGGNNNAESSGVLRHVVIKHAGFEVVDGDELNALTLNAVGSGTTIQYVQTYTTQDDGFEMFGGAVHMDHIVAVNIGDDSIDYSEGYNGDIQYAVVVHTSGGNRCIEGDNTGGNRDDGFTPTTKLRISNLTCVTSGVDEGAGTNPSSKGDSEGPLYREGAHFEMYNSIITSNAADMASNECLELHDTEGPQTVAAALDGTSRASSNLIACSEPLQTNRDGFSVANWLAGTVGDDNQNRNNHVIANLPMAMLLDGGPGSRAYRTLSAIQDSTGAEVTVPRTPVGTSLGGIFENPAYLGGASASDDWLAGWAVGLDAQLNP